MMTLPQSRAPGIPASTPEGVARIRAVEGSLKQCEQLPIVTHHLIHAGMYARTVTIPAGAWITGALIKRATILVVSGDVVVATGDESVRLIGYHVLPASAHRKQAFAANKDTDLTMIFPTRAEDIETAEAEFTDEVELLSSRRDQNVVHITGE